MDMSYAWRTRTTLIICLAVLWPTRIRFRLHKAFVSCFSYFNDGYFGYYAASVMNPCELFKEILTLPGTIALDTRYHKTPVSTRCMY